MCSATGGRHAPVARLAVLDLCCGVGYGTQILREEAASAVGVDFDEGAVTEALAAAGRAGSDVTFETGDAHRWLEEDLAERFDAIVCFEGLEHLPDLDRALDRLAVHAGRGVRLLLSVPNSRTFEERDEFHFSDLDYDSAMTAFGRFAEGRVYFQYVAEGALILAGDDDMDEAAQLLVPDRSEPEYANTFLRAVNVPAEDLDAAAAHMRFTLAPHQTRELRNLVKANEELWITNRELGRQLRDVAAELELRGGPVAAVRSARPPSVPSSANWWTRTRRSWTHTPSRWPTTRAAWRPSRRTQQRVGITTSSCAVARSSGSRSG